MTTTLYSETLREQVIAALIAANTLAGARVYAPRDWPVVSAIMPALLVDDVRENSESRTNQSIPQFWTTTTISVGGRVEAATAEAAKALLSTLRYQVKIAVMQGVGLRTIVPQEVKSIRTETRVSAESRMHVGEVQIDFDMLYPEDFDPPIIDELVSVYLNADMVNVFQKTGTVTPPFPIYTPTTSPRTTGPDGRPEGLLELTLPQ